MMADYKINKILIFSFIIVIIFSLLLKSDIFKVNKGYFFISLYFLPLNALLIACELRDSYLSDSKSYARKCINFISYYLFICCISFISLVIIKLFNINFLTNYGIIVYFIPVFLGLFLINIVWLFLFYGYNQLEYTSNYFLILTNILFYSTMSLVVYMKLSFFILVSWRKLAILIIFLQSINTVYWLQSSLKSSDKFDFSASKKDSLTIVLSISINTCLFIFLYSYALLLDLKIFPNSELIIYLSSFFFCFFNILNCCYKISKINSYIEWKKNVLI